VTELLNLCPIVYWFGYGYFARPGDGRATSVLIRPCWSSVHCADQALSACRTDDVDCLLRLYRFAQPDFLNRALRGHSTSEHEFRDLRGSISASSADNVL
jgi:hypothetical protein